MTGVALAAGIDASAADAVTGATGPADSGIVRGAARTGHVAADADDGARSADAPEKDEARGGKAAPDEVAGAVEDSEAPCLPTARAAGAGGGKTSVIPGRGPVDFLLVPRVACHRSGASKAGSMRKGSARASTA